jgi:hypothetical protein
MCAETDKDHREDAKRRKREKPSPFIHNNSEDFVLFIVEFIPMNVGTLSR